MPEATNPKPTADACPRCKSRDVIHEPTNTPPIQNHGWFRCESCREHWVAPLPSR